METRPSTRVAVVMAAVVGLLAPAAFGVEGYYRQPAIHGDTVVFVAEGDLWTVSAQGGVARRLTTHLDEETHPAIHPDGDVVAFSARYEGTTEVYTMPLAGGSPSRWTWEEDRSTVVGWTPSGELVYSTRALSTLPQPLLVRVDLSAETRSPVPLAEASDGAFAADGTVFFARPAWHANNTKRYQGGTARDLWRFRPGEEEAVALTDFDGEDHSPMWWNGRLYSVNDRDGTMNIWSTDADGADLRQHTRHSGWDVEDPSVGPTSAGGGAIVYQVGADLWLLDLATDESRRLDIDLASDFDQLRDRWVKDPLSSMTDVALSPDGDRVVVTTRGRVFVLPAKVGRRVRVAPKPGVRYRSATFLPGPEGGSTEILLLGDETGEQEFYRAPADGTGEAVQITEDSPILNFDGVPSPDGLLFAYSDRANDLWIVEMATGERRRVNDLSDGVGDFVWSPDSRWLVWERAASNSFVQLHLTDVTARGDAFSPGVELTSDRTNSFSPVFSRDGDWIYFLSDRNLRSLVGSPWGPRQPEPYFDASIQLFQLALQEGLRPTFRPPDELMEDEPDEGGDGGEDLGEDGEGEGEEGDEKEGGEPEPPEPVHIEPVHIDVDGISSRVWEIPVEPGNYSSLATDGENLYFRSRESGPSPKTHLVGVPLSVEKVEDGELPVTTVVSDIAGFQVSRDAKKMLVVREGALFVVDTGLVEISELVEQRVPTDGFSFPISVREDFRQIFLDAWRLERDYFYDPGMHGVDWEAMRDKYLPLVDRVTTRTELSDLIGELVGELSALHVSVRGGDEREGEEDIAVPSLGARLRRDPAAGGFVVEHVYRTDPDYPSWRGPLADPWVDVEAGDVILAVDGRPAVEARQMGALLRGKAGEQVLLELLDVSRDEERRVVVVPSSDPRELRYQDWEISRRLETERLGEGRLGYVHLRAMGGGNLSEWYRNFYPAFDRQGLIIDVRNNRGGNIDSILLEKLLRRAWFYWAPRHGEPTWNMQYAFRGHMVVLVNAQTASDGEAFAEGFRRLGLGKVIGTRTWGGEIWLSNNNRLSDGGIARAPQTGVYADGEWLIEGWGVVPDIEVDNLPRETFDGRDRQLEVAVAHLLELIEEDPRPVPEPPEYPDKSFGYPEPE